MELEHPCDAFAFSKHCTRAFGNARDAHPSRGEHTRAPISLHYAIGSVLAWIRLASGIRSSQQEAGTEWVIFSENELGVPREVRTSLNLRHHGGGSGGLPLPYPPAPEARPNGAGG